MASFPTPVPSAVTAQPLPPLPDLSSTASTGGGSADPTSSSPLAAIMSGIMPIKSGVDAIQAACQQIVKAGTIPGAEQICGQIVALATSLLPMAAQAAMGPGAATGMGNGPSMAPMPPPSNGPAAGI